MDLQCVSDVKWCYRLGYVRHASGSKLNLCLEQIPWMLTRPGPVWNPVLHMTLSILNAFLL